MIKFSDTVYCYVANCYPPAHFHPKNVFKAKSGHTMVASVYWYDAPLNKMFYWNEMHKIWMSSGRGHASYSFGKRLAKMREIMGYSNGEKHGMQK